MSYKIAALVALFAAGTLAGCNGEDKLTGTAKDIPPGFVRQAPPLDWSPKDLAKSGVLNKSRGGVAGVRHP